jgi:hypothetical protein
VEPTISSTFSLSDDELDHVISLASAVPIAARSGFLEAVASALSAYPASARGLGLVREAARLQRDFAATPSLRNVPSFRK